MIKRKSQVKFILMTIGLLSISETFSQPVFDSKVEVLEHFIYKDNLDTSVYYYEPENIYLSKDEDGKPDISYLKMTRSKSISPQEITVDDFSVIQLKLKTVPIAQHTIENITTAIGKKEIELRPIPIQKFEFNLLTGIESVGKKTALASHLNSSFDIANSDLWLEKNITIQLSKEAAQLIDDNLERNNELGLEFIYSYYANFVSDNVASLLKKTNESDGQEMNTFELIQFKNGQVDLSFDFARWRGSCIKKLVLNEEVLPRYHPVQLTCYDFSDGLRPDLLAKKVVVCGSGLRNKEICTKELEFSVAEPEVNSISLKFKFPILFNKPLRYRVTEIDLTGSISRNDWVEVSFEKIIDATSYKVSNSLENKMITIWANKDDFANNGFLKSDISFQYMLLGKLLNKKITLEPSEQSLLATSIYCDSQTPIRYSLLWKGNNDQILKSEPFKTLENNIIKLTP